jgi:hypothetical protein
MLLDQMWARDQVVALLPISEQVLCPRVPRTPCPPALTSAPGASGRAVSWLMMN